VVSFVQVYLPKLCIRLSSALQRATCPAHLVLLDFITRTILSKQYRSLGHAVVPGGAVVKALRYKPSWVQFPTVSEFLIDIILPFALWPWGRLSL
jgi:hypothetical protein